MIAFPAPKVHPSGGRWQEGTAEKSRVIIAALDHFHYDVDAACKRFRCLPWSNSEARRSSIACVGRHRRRRRQRRALCCALGFRRREESPGSRASARGGGGG